MSSRKADLGGVDEAFLLDSIKSGGRSEFQLVEQTPEKPKEVVKRKRISSADYTATYLQCNEIKTRHSVYISREIHRKILKIVNVIADQQISVGGYIDTVLAQHLEANRENINELYRQARQSDQLI